LVLLGAAWFGHGGNGWVFSNPNGGWEYPVFWAIVCVALALMGPGAMAVGSSDDAKG
jgi:putative oxidoreductase